MAYCGKHVVFVHIWQQRKDIFFIFKYYYYLAVGFQYYYFIMDVDYGVSLTWAYTYNPYEIEAREEMSRFLDLFEK